MRSAFIDDFENKEVFDPYCGTGTITGCWLAKLKEVIGIELVEEAVEAAKANAAQWTGQLPISGR